MKRFLYFLCVVAVMGSGLAVVLYYGNQPSPVSRIELSRFQSPENFAAALVENLREELKKSPVLLLGLMPDHEEELEVVEKFLSLLKGPELRYDVVVVEPGLGPEGFFPDATSVSFVREFDRLAEGVRNAGAQGLRTVVIGPGELMSGLGESGGARKLKERFQIEAMSLTLAPFPWNRSEEKSLPFTCRTENQDSSGMGSIGCVIVQIARTTYRMDKDPARFMGRLDKVGERDYLALLHPPLMKEVEP